MGKFKLTVQCTVIQKAVFIRQKERRKTTSSCAFYFCIFQVMGEYEDPEFKEKQRRRSAPLPSRPPGLYPLTEVGNFQSNHNL